MAGITVDLDTPRDSVILDGESLSLPLSALMMERLRRLPEGSKGRDLLHIIEGTGRYALNAEPPAWRLNMPPCAPWQHALECPACHVKICLSCGGARPCECVR
jgi:hypothetical protein